MVDKKTPLPGNKVSINSFGVGGTNVHVILRANDKKTQSISLPALEIPRLVFLSGRTREALTEQFETVVALYIPNSHFNKLSCSMINKKPYI